VAIKEVAVYDIQETTQGINSF